MSRDRMRRVGGAADLLEVAAGPPATAVLVDGRPAGFDEEEQPTSPAKAKAQHRQPLRASAAAATRTLMVRGRRGRRLRLCAAAVAAAALLLLALAARHAAGPAVGSGFGLPAEHAALLGEAEHLHRKQQPTTYGMEAIEQAAASLQGQQAAAAVPMEADHLPQQAPPTPTPLGQPGLGQGIEQLPQQVQQQAQLLLPKPLFTGAGSEQAAQQALPQPQPQLAPLVAFQAGQQAAAVELHPLAAPGGTSPAAAAAAVVVEFTAPGLLLPLRDALDASQPERPEEAALLLSLPPPGPAAQQRAAAHPTLAQVLQHYEQAAAVGAGDAGKASGAGAGPDGAAAAGGGGGAQQEAAAKLQRTAADLANELQYSLQQKEEAALREKREAREAALREQKQAAQGGAASAGSGGDQSYEAAASEALQRANERLPLGLQQAEPEEDGDEAASIRMLVGVVSACCSEAAAQRRAAIRKTWGREVAARPGVDLRFFLAQPPTPEALTAWLPAIQAEVAAHNDTVVLRGADSYRNLPNKTLRLLRYFVAHPAGYTHVLKIDDDVYLRIGRVLRALRAPADADLAVAPPGRRLPATHQQLLEAMGREGSGVLHTDGVQLYNTSLLVARAGAAAARKSLDDAEGEPVSLADMAKQAAAAAAARKQQQQLLQQQRAAVGAGLEQPAAAAGRQVQQAAGAGAAGSGSSATDSGAEAPPAAGGQMRMTGVYMGCLENKGGFFPIRDPGSKWYVPYDEMPDSAVPYAVKYLAGWGVVLSRDTAQHAAAKANLWQRRPELAPAWFAPLHWEDVMLGLLLMDAVPAPQDNSEFRAAWRACPATTALKHLDVDAPRLFKGLYEQDVSGLWDAKPVQCASGDFLPGDYGGWKKWRDALPTVEHI